MENEKITRTIYLKDLVFVALYRWKWIVAAMLVFALLLGGMKFMQTKDTVTLDPVSLTPEMELKITDLQENLAFRQEASVKQSAYLKDSIYMQLDPYAAYTAGKYYYIAPLTESAEQSDLIATMIKMYTVMIYEGTALQKLTQKLDAPEWAVRELITIRTDGCLQVTAHGRTAEEAQFIADTVCADIEAQQDIINQTVAPHTLSSLPFLKGPVIDTGLYDAQLNARNKLTNLQNNIVSTEAELNRILPTELQAGNTKPLLFAVIGALLGACLVIGIAWIGHIARGTVYSVRTLKDHTGIPILGCVSTGKKYDVLTCWFQKLEGRTAYGKIDAVYANVRNRCKHMKTLLLMGNYCSEEIRPLVDALAQDGITCTTSGDPAQAAQVFQALPDCDAVILVETCGRSRYESIVWEIETVHEYKKELLGCILIGG